MKKLSLSVLIVFISLLGFGLFAVATPASAMTCNSATFTGTVDTGTPPTHARFTYSTDYSTVANGGGTPTAVQVFNTQGSFPIEQYVSGLSENTSYSYRLEVTNNYGTKNLNIVTFTTPACNTTPVQNPTVTLSANPTSIQSGGNSTLSWSSSNATSCNAYWTSSTATNGSGVVTPTSTTTYNITCINSTGQQVNGSATVYVQATQTCQDPSAINYGGTLPCRYQQTPTVTLSANPTSIQSGGNSTLSWSSSNATSCNAYWTSSTATNGSGVVVPTSTTSYSITCTSSTGQQATTSATVYVNQVVQNSPTVNIYASPTSVSYGGSSTINWSSTNATYCSASGGTNNWSGTQSTYGNFYTGVLYSTTTYSIICTSSTGQQASSSATVYVNGQNNYSTTSVTISADQTSLVYGGSTTIRWYPNNANYCYGSGGNNGWSGTQSAYGSSFSTGPLYYTTTYTISCSNYNSNNGSATNSVTIYVGNNNQNIYQPIVYQPVTNNSLTAVTTHATQILNTSAQLNSLIGSSANSSTNAWFEWGRTINLGNRTTSTAVGSLPSVIHTDTLTGLDAGTTYYFRAVAESSSLRSVGSILSFTTGGEQVIQYVQRTTTTTTPTSLVLITSSVDRNQAIVPTIDNTRPHPGDEINYTINYQNVGNGAVTNLTLQATLPGEVDYLTSTPTNPVISGNTLVFNLGTLRANGNGVVTIKVRVKDTAPAGTNLDFPATLSYINPSGQSQSINTTVSAQVWKSNTSDLGAFVFGAGFFPGNIFGWLLLIILILLLILLARYLYARNPQSFIKKTTTTVDHQPALGKKITTTTVEQ